MSAGEDAIALLGAVQHFSEAGHTFQFSHNTAAGGVYATISGPTGSRSASRETVQAALTDLVVQIVSARLEGAIPAPQPVHNPGVFDDLGRDSYF